MRKSLLLLLCTGLLAPAAPLLAAELTVAPADEDERPGRAGPGLLSLLVKPAAPKLAYPVRIDTADKDIRSMIETHLPLITQQQQEELDREQAEFLAEDAPAQINTMLETRGYFNAKVAVAPEASGWHIRIEPGPRTHIDTVNVAILGDILSEDNLAQYYQNAMENWSLPVGAPFTQSDWSGSKSSVLAAVVRKKYPLASISASRATVDPNRNLAQLSLMIDSRQPVYFGDLHISGTERYPEQVVRGLARFQPGDPYDLDKVLDYQQALEQDSHYGAAAVTPDFAAIRDGRVPVKVSVSEMQRQKLDVGLRYDSADGPGLRLGYEHYNVFKRGYVFSTLTDADRYQTTLAVGLSQPRKDDGHYWTSNLAYNRATTQKLEKEAVSSGIWYVRDKNNIDARLGLEFLTESNRVSDGPDLGRSQALMLTAAWKRQNITTLLRPANGYYLEGKIGTTLGSLGSSTDIQRLMLRAGYYYTPQERKYGTWVLRGQMGYVRARSDADVPSGLMFRSGGATSVRGYEFDSIGRSGPNGAILPDRLLGVASVEYQLPVSKDFSLALFHDAATVSHDFKGMQWRHGSGFGVRWFSPLAPFAFDIARGHHDKKIRWHISLGTRF